MGLVLIPIVIEMAGSSTVMSGRGRGSSDVGEGLADRDLGMPATAMMSPGPALSPGLRSRASVISSSVILTVLVLPSRRHQATCCPLRMPVVDTQQCETTQEGLEASRLVTCAWSGASSSYVGAGIVSKMVRKSGSRLSPSGSVPSPGASSAAMPALPEA
jgi:hypothetical protein